MIRIMYEPFISGNSYVQTNKELLSHIGEVSPMPKIAEVVKYAAQRVIGLRKGCLADVCVINWLENICASKSGRLKVSGVVKMLIFMLAARAAFRKVIWVRHNIVPHGVKGLTGAILEMVFKLLESMSTTVAMHSKDARCWGRNYLPHPLYKSTGFFDCESKYVEDYFVCFGRLEPYKNYHQLISVWPDNARLVISGSTTDQNYLAKLVEMAAGKNIVINGERITDQEAAQLVGSAKALLLTHAERDMVVSGSYYYALSCGVAVIALETPHLEYLRDTDGAPGLLTAKTIEEIVKIAVAFDAQSREPILEFAMTHYSDAEVEKHWRAIITGS
jgi:beta-1,4-mannosyltransferase